MLTQVWLALMPWLARMRAMAAPRPLTQLRFRFKTAMRLRAGKRISA